MVFLLVWVECGVFAYGLTNGATKKFLEGLNYAGYDKIGELLCILHAITGPLGLVNSLVLTVCVDRTSPSLCYRMPKELCKGYGKRS